VQAGLLSQLRQGAIGDSDYWGVIVTRPADDPFKQLATKGFMVESQGFVESVRAWLTEHPKQTRLVLAIDQFEELLTTCPEMIRQNFIRQLTSLLESPVPITVILVMRDDFYNQLVQQEALVERLERSLGPINIPQTLKWDEVIAIVQKPAKAVGLRFEEGLVETIVNDAMETAAFPVDEGRVARSTILPLLEFALTELWGKREEGILSRRAYNAIDGVTGGLTRWADRVFYGLKTKEEQWEEKQRMEQQRLARRIFTDLVHIGNESQGLPNSRRRMSLASLCRKESEIADVRQVVQQLVDGHLLVTTYDMQRKEEMVEIIHDALLWEWGQLRQWLQDDHDFLIWHQEFEKRVRGWVETNVVDPTEREEDKLFGGSDLTKAIEWLLERVADLSQVEQDFIQASQKRQEQEELLHKHYAVSRRRLLMASVTGGVVLSIIGGGAAIWGWQSIIAPSIIPYIDIHAYTAHKASVWRVAWSRDASRIVSVGADRTAQVWFANTGRPIFTYKDHKAPVTAASWSKDGYYIASASYDMKVQVWNPDGQNSLYKPYTYSNHTDLVLAVAWSPDGQYIASAGHDRTVQVWQLGSSGPLYKYQNHTDAVNTVAWSPDSKRIASGSGDNTVQVWDATTGQGVLIYRGHTNHVLSVAWSPNGKRIASAGGDKTVQVWDAADGHHPYIYTGHTGYVYAVAWSPDGQRIASAGSDGTVQIWDAANGNPLYTFRLPGTTMWSVAWSPDGKRIASGSNNNTVQVWNATDGSYQFILGGHTDFVYSVSWSPDGKHIASASGDKTVRIWDATNGHHISTYTGHTNSVRSVSWASDSKRLASASWDKIVQVWQVQ